MNTAFVAVPGFAGPQGAVAALAVAVVAVLLGVAVGGRDPARLVVGLVVAALAALVLRQLPSELNDRRLQYDHQSAVGVTASLASVQHEVGVDGSFLAWVARRLPPDATFYVVSGGTTTSAPQSWSQFVLMPRLERYDRACAADWIVFADAPPHVQGVALGAAERYRTSNDWISPVKDRCTR